MDGSSRPDDPRHEAATASIRQLRTGLLDLTGRNPLISYPHATRTGARAHVRAVHTPMNVLFAQLAEGKTLSIRPLPEPEDEPEDERTDQFRAMLEMTRATDAAYVAAFAALTEDELTSPQAARVERALRDAAREALGLPPWQAAQATGLAEHAARCGINPSYELPPAAPEEPGRAAPAELQTLMPPDALERALSRIRDTARTVAEETGVGTLHLAFGFLEWFESDSAEKPFVSPLLLLRVDIDRRIVRSRYQYVLAGTGDEAEVNRTLAERLDRDFRIQLPLPTEDELPEAYLARVAEEVCQGRKRWAVRRYVTLAHFPFARLAMFHDLDETAWAEAGGLASRPLLLRLLGGGASGGALFAEEHEIDAPSVADRVPALVLDADASQHSAVYDVMTGQNLVIEGPPGTGKSQTITNIIAAALADGKTVLFVADKQAALQVVKDRLDKVGLGDFCLELHSGKARKKDVLDGLAQRLAHLPAAPGPEALEARLRDLAATRAALTRYVEILNAPLGTTGGTVHDALWADRRRRDGESEAARRLDALDLPGADTLTRSDIERRRAVLERFERAAAPILAQFGAPAAHPWHGVTRADLSSVDFDPAVRETADAAAAMEAVARAAAALAPLGLERPGLCPGPAGALRPQTPDTLSEGFPKGSALWRGPGAEPLAFATALAHLPAAPDIPAAWHRGLASDAMRRAGAEWLRAEAASRAALARLGEHGLALPPPALRPAAEALEAGHATLAVAAPPGLALTGLPGWSATLRAEAASLATLARLAHRAAELLGLAAPLTLPALGIALRAINLVAEGGETVIAGITPTLAEREHRVIIAAAAAEIAALQQAAETLAARFALPPAAQAEELRRHAAALRDAGLLGFLSAAPKAAARRHAELRKQPGKPGRDEMAADLAALAGHLEAVAALEARAEYRAVFGFRFRGLATDAATALAIADWAARVRGDLSGLDEATQTARRVLLAADPERLQAIAAFAAEPGYAALQRCLGATSEAVTLDDLAARLDAMAHAAAGLAEGCDRLGIPGATALAALPDLCRLLRDAAASFEAAALPPPLAAALGEHPPAPLADHAGFAAALALAAAIAALPVPEPARQVLHAMDPAEIRDEVVVAARRVEAALDRALALWRALADRLGLDEAAFLGGAPHHAAPAAVAERLRHAATHGAALGGWIAFLIERRNAEALGLGGLLALWDEQAVSGPLADAFDRVLHRGLARLAFARHPEIDRFTGLGQEEARRRFKALDAEVTELRRRMLAASLATRPVPDGNHVGRRGEWTDRALILAETGKQKKHLPIRQLLDRAGAAVQTLKPCFMMSPLSVAQYLKPTGLRFDLLVIDEASQMRPEDALGAIARAEQIVVVGDTKQLPPTSFFARLDDDSEDTDAEPIEAESILDLAQTVFRPMRRLRWHYRSRHGSLVAFSNREFYDDDLIVFPSPAEADPRQGVGSTKIDGIYKSNVNPAEVAAICAAAVEHMRAEPHRSLGIATMNQAQRELIAEEMDRLATLHPDVEAYRERWANTLERFFVKNLENVQGDERDVIFISTVFGPPAPGQRVRQNFGPINGPSGHRRLNVLFTRAKHRVHLFTSMTPDDIVAGPESPRGAQVLKRYLAYAASGGWLDAGEVTGRAPDSDFEVFVADRLRAAGYDVVPQVGVSGFFIDLAVRDPDMPGAFLLGVECDGATYHSSRSARDRDILRQEVLEGLGWTLYRIWSTDWFRDPKGQTEKLVGFIEDLRRRRGEP